MKLFKIIKTYLGWIKHLILTEQPLCRIEKIDTIKKIFYIHCRGIDTPVKLKFQQLAADETILFNLPPQQASWVGYYCGEFYKQMTDIEHFIHPTLNLEDPQKKYQMIAQDRLGNISFLDKSTHTLYTKAPLNILTKQNIISQFTQIDAYHIGFLYRMAIDKNTRRKKLKTSAHSSVHLQLIKNECQN